MNLIELKEALKPYPKYRLKQAIKAIFVDFIDDWSLASNFPLETRKELSEKADIKIKGEMIEEKEGRTAKALITFEDDLKIETVLMRHGKNHNTVCLSSQVGCPLACKFCATGENGYRRNLTVDEIINQVLFFARYLRKKYGSSEKISNVVFMGMGEPFLNYDNVLKAIKILNDKDFFNIGARRISVSTVGIIEGIRKFAKEKLQINLAISLHFVNDDLRTKMMPINKKYPLEKILKEVNQYIEKTSRKVMFEYLMIKGVNDSISDAKKLACLIKKPLYFLNLILCNPVNGFLPPDSKTALKFKKILQREGVSFKERFRFGGDIKAACGQLAGEKK